MRFLSVDPLAADYAAWSGYHYVLGNPLVFVDPDGKFPIDPNFQTSFPNITSFIQNGLQGYVTGSSGMMDALLTYSGRNLTSSQVNSDFLATSGPTFQAVTSETFNAHFDKMSNAIQINVDVLNRIETMLNHPSEAKQAIGKMEFTNVFINEYTHYGDALDGNDLVEGPNGELVNDPESQEPCEPYCSFDEGNAAAAKIFPNQGEGDMKKNYHRFKSGRLTERRNNQDVLTKPNKDLIDLTLIPK
jgi:hypothetical protein